MSFLNKNKVVTTCFACNEDVLSTGNYTIKVLPSKRIPKKIRKLMKRKAEGRGKSSLLEDTEANRSKKFNKFALERSMPSNTMEITCGVCKSVSKIPMRKFDKSRTSPTKGKTPYSSSTATTPNSTPASLSRSQKKKQRRSKTPKELNAGLIIPESLRQSADNDEKERKLKTTVKSDQKQSTPNLLAVPSEEIIVVPPKRRKQTKSEEIKSTKEKQLASLRKTLFKSNNSFGASSSKSLEDFLS